MNYARLAMAAIAATVFDALYGFLVYGMLLAPEFAKYPGVYRSNEAGQAFLPLMFGGLLIAIAAAAIIYAKAMKAATAWPKERRFGFARSMSLAWCSRLPASTTRRSTSAGGWRS
jgi:hypothetical protein